tara:strand:- start:9547 stop:9801 length:255 start_codon:yes stop_codon:yes gene_type:complete
MSTVALIFALIAIIGSIVSLLIIWRVDHKIMRSLDLTGHRINRIESDAIAMRSRLGSVEKITDDHGRQLYQLNAAVFDKTTEKN